MSELRAPDPTIVELGMVGMQWGTRPTPTAHRIDTTADNVDYGDERSVCGLLFSTHRLIDAIHAAYIAVPCRECWPDAPPPGRGACPCGHRSCAKNTPSGLDWQVQP